VGVLYSITDVVHISVYSAINCVRVLDERNAFLFNVRFKWRSATED